MVILESDARISIQPEAILRPFFFFFAEGCETSNQDGSTYVLRRLFHLYDIKKSMHQSNTRTRLRFPTRFWIAFSSNTPFVPGFLRHACIHRLSGIMVLTFNCSAVIVLYNFYLFCCSSFVLTFVCSAVLVVSFNFNLFSCSCTVQLAKLSFVQLSLYRLNFRLLS